MYAIKFRFRSYHIYLSKSAKKIGSSIYKYTLMLTDMKSIFDDRDYLTYSDLILKKKFSLGGCIKG